MKTAFNNARYLYAAALIEFGILQFITGTFVMGRAPSWDWALPVAPVWAYFTGIIFIAAGTAIFLNWKARPIVSLAGIIIFVAPAVRFIPVILADHNFGGDWTNFFKSLALAGGTFIVAGSLPGEPKTGNIFSAFTNFADDLRPAGRYFIGMFFIVAGTQHFIFADFVMLMVPSWIPAPLFWTYFAGMCLLSAGLGLMIDKTVRLAALLSGIMIFTWMIILHIPRALAAPGDVSEWQGVVETMAFSGILFVIVEIYKGKKTLIK